ncbi:FAD-dependent oxidoreductase [Nitrospirillum viridazoti]|uniref:2-polyprenyl-6-methoxyphenol hydroxylase n=1 Tax=Nitrospirillum viridazoti CBAmc TaxID=1441467 RepID=A0A248JVQ3_9PROT|nr:FAD-dependent oxidoreductase [Nitrospirillum amazonense]ASG22596.1 2-polyprenyl-6-methoxyphenol hydroxylase [Nitrospirillum amazonense CBAmc]TWB42836.1 2-polyprenyl-6-methoxyphenol hydroxylase-like FAD-dependent oxidoreductase [Nitrospirillum amazonense]
MARFDTDILIVGAGAAGLTLALDLARRGVGFRLVEKNAGPFPGSRGKGLQPRSLEVFEDLGVLADLQAVGGPYPTVLTYEGGQVVRTQLHDVQPPTPAEPYGNPLMVPQFQTEAVLRRRLAGFGHAPAFAKELTSFDQDAEGVTARLRTTEGEVSLRARYLVGTDGGRSFVRHALAIGFPGETLPFRAIIGDMPIAGLAFDAWHRWYAPDAQLALCPLAGTDLFQVVAQVPDEVTPTRDLISAIVRERTGRDDLTVGEPTWLSTLRVNLRLADRYRMGRVFIAGDAAHVHPPTGGQGLNTSVQDAYNLGWKLAAVLRGASDGLLDSYEAERRPIAAHVLGLSGRLLGQMGTAEGMRRGRETRELDLSYRDGPLATESGAVHGRVVAGDRAPDAPCRTAAGTPTRLFEVYQGPHFTLLGYGVDEDGAGGGWPEEVRALTVAPQGSGQPADLADDAGHVAQAYDLTPGTWVLVRPDGYIAATARDAGAIRDWLWATTKA